MQVFLISTMFVKATDRTAEMTIDDTTHDATDDILPTDSEAPTTSPLSKISIGFVWNFVEED